MVFIDKKFLTLRQLYHKYYNLMENLNKKLIDLGYIANIQTYLDDLKKIVPDEISTASLPICEAKSK